MPEYTIEIKFATNDDTNDVAWSTYVDLNLENYELFDSIKLCREGKVMDEYSVQGYTSAQRAINSKYPWAKKLLRCGNCDSFTHVDHASDNRVNGHSDGECDCEKLEKEQETKFGYLCREFKPEQYCPLCGRMMFVWHSEYWDSPVRRSICRNCQIIIPANIIPEYMKLFKYILKFLNIRKTSTEKLLKELSVQGEAIENMMFGKSVKAMMGIFANKLKKH